MNAKTTPTPVPTPPPSPAGEQHHFGLTAAQWSAIAFGLLAIVIGFGGYWIKRVDDSTSKLTDRVTEVEKGLVKVDTKIDNIEKSQVGVKSDLTEIKRLIQERNRNQQK